MSKYTKEDIWRMIEEEDVEFIRLQFTDIFGTLKNVAVTTSQLERVLNNEIINKPCSLYGPRYLPDGWLVTRAES